MSDDDRERIVRARVSDPDLLDALEAAEEGATMAEVLRECMESHLINDGVSEDVSGLSQVARRGLRSLRQNIDGATGMVEVSTAESQIANACNIPKETVRPSVFEPLRRHGRIGLHHTVEHVFIVVEAPEPVRTPERVTASD